MYQSTIKIIKPRASRGHQLQLLLSLNIKNIKKIYKNVYIYIVLKDNLNGLYKVKYTPMKIIFLSLGQKYSQLIILIIKAYKMNLDVPKNCLGRKLHFVDRD